MGPGGIKMAISDANLTSICFEITLLSLYMVESNVPWRFAGKMVYRLEGRSADSPRRRRGRGWCRRTWAAWSQPCQSCESRSRRRPSWLGRRWRRTPWPRTGRRRGRGAASCSSGRLSDPCADASPPQASAATTSSLVFIQGRQANLVVTVFGIRAVVGVVCVPEQTAGYERLGQSFYNLMWLREPSFHPHR